MDYMKQVSAFSEVRHAIAHSMYEFSWLRRGFSIVSVYCFFSEL